MRICIAQSKSYKGDIDKNIKNHLEIIEYAVEGSSDLVIFPELSITGYEPDLAKRLAVDVADTIFDRFQKLSDKHNIAIGVGMPTKGQEGIHISMIMFRPGQHRGIYSKQLLHEDELPYFVEAKDQRLFEINGKKVAVGICYETLQREHFLKSKQAGADIYIASVAKPKAGETKAYHHFSKIANEFKTPILMANSVGFCDNFLSFGQSAVWNEKGVRLSKLDIENQGVLIYETELNEVAVSYI